MPKQPTKAAKHLIDQLCGNTGYVVEGHGKAFLDKSRNQTYQAADDAGLRVAVEKLEWIVKNPQLSRKVMYAEVKSALCALNGELESDDAS